jgi:hypothetical protein
MAAAVKPIPDVAAAGHVFAALFTLLSVLSFAATVVLLYRTW